MNNFINVRTQAHNHIKIYTSFKHNLRHTQSSKSQSNDNPNYIVYDNKFIKLDNQNKKIYFDKISKEYQKDRLEHNEKFKAHYKRNLRPTQGSWMEGVFTFSDQIKVDLENKNFTTLELTRIAFNAANEISKIYGGELKSLILHMDETTPHFHYHIKNFDEKGMSLFNQNKNKNFLSNLQDIGFKYFGKLGMNRGIKKEISGINYKKASKYLEETISKQKQDINDLKELYDKHFNECVDKINLKNKELIELDIKLNELQTQKENIRSQLLELKNERIEITKDIDLTKEEKKQLYENISKGQEELRKLQKDIQEEQNTIKGRMKAIESDTKLIIDNSSSFLGFDKDKLETNIKRELIKYSNLKTINTIEKELKQEVKILKEEILKKETRINELIVEKNKLNDINSVLTNNNTQIKQKLSLDIQNLEKEQKLFLGTLKRQNQKLRDRTKYLKKILKDQNVKITRDQIRLTLNKPKPKPKKIEQELNNLSRI
ncbi:plasmid recombination protein [Aliarcobacter butzleri]|uniref:plasmid recombination protein n=1 Tax=Aliarcobacter butzleri TaxID=28197 RepID=UPI002B245A84|nr:plasmid recombination protein [Aliarcobacter butzleri]